MSKSSDIPMFVSFGFDDNGIQESLKWASDLFAEYGSASFFLSSHFIDNPGIRDEWARLIKNGHEVGNHTHNHSYGGDFLEDDWREEITKCNRVLRKDIGLSKVYGFRAPYLGYNSNTFKVVKDLGFLYDCSTEEGWDSEFDGTNFPWPKKVDGLWYMPCYPVILPPDDLCKKYGLKSKIRGSKVGVSPEDEPFDDSDGKITGLDYNMLVSFKMNKDEYLATLKYTFDLRIHGNRCPMLVGAHSDFYHNSFDLAPNITPMEMREVLTEFLDYVSSFDSVKVVSYNRVIEYLEGL